MGSYGFLNYPQFSSRASEVSEDGQLATPQRCNVVLQLQGILEVLKENKGQVLRYIHVSTDEARVGAMQFKHQTSCYKLLELYNIDSI